MDSGFIVLRDFINNRLNSNLLFRLHVNMSSDHKFKYQQHKQTQEKCKFEIAIISSSIDNCSSHSEMLFRFSQKNDKLNYQLIFQNPIYMNRLDLCLS